MADAVTNKPESPNRIHQGIHQRVGKGDANVFLDGISCLDRACRDASASAHSSG